VSASVTVEKGVPIPEEKQGKRKWPFGSMQVGESFLVPADVRGPYAVCLAGIANRQWKPMHFVGRATPDGYRIWRTA
jgi:hypothetical protein